MTTIEKIAQTTQFIQKKCNLKPQLAITLGSGLSSFADQIDIAESIPYQDIPHFSPPSVTGHKGQLVFGHIDQLPVVILQGRIHFYEGHTLEEVVFPTRVISALGARALVLTNAAGGLDKNMPPGSLMVIRDHINLTGNNPLIGKNIEELGPRFPDMSQAYDLQFIKLLKETYAQLGLNYYEGIYCGVTGPSYETAAEVRYLGSIGGSAVGMSTVPEAIAARHIGLRLAGISCITNFATGLSDEKISHDDVKDIAKRVENEFSQLLLHFAKRCPLTS